MLRNLSEQDLKQINAGGVMDVLKKIVIIPIRPIIPVPVVPVKKYLM